MRPVDGTLRWPMGEKRVGWIAGDDIAAVAAKVLAEGPERHAGKNNYLSTDLLNGTEIAGVLSRATDRPIEALIVTRTTSGRYRLWPTGHAGQHLPAEARNPNIHSLKDV